MPLPARFNDPYRARHRTAEQIRSGGAVGSLNDGIEIELHPAFTSPTARSA